MGKRDIDYSLPANEILWQALEKSAKFILNRKHLRIPKDAWDDLKMDIEVAAHKRVVSRINEWDRKHEFANFVYWHVWSVSGPMVDELMKKRQWESDNLVSTSKLLSLDGSSDTVGDTLVHNNLTYRSEVENSQRKHRNEKMTPVKLRHKAENDYQDYCDCCTEFGIQPMSYDDYTSNAGDAPQSLEEEFRA